jgi:hypothetical protein
VGADALSAAAAAVRQERAGGGEKRRKRMRRMRWRKQWDAGARSRLGRMRARTRTLSGKQAVTPSVTTSPATGSRRW